MLTWDRRLAYPDRAVTRSQNRNLKSLICNTCLQKTHSRIITAPVFVAVVARDRCLSVGGISKLRRGRDSRPTPPNSNMIVYSNSGLGGARRGQ